MFDWLIKRHVEDAVAEALRTKVPAIVSAKAPAIIAEHLRKRFSEEPKAELTEAGFVWAFHLALEEMWPSVDIKTSSSWLWEFIEAPFGIDGYEWTPRAARELANEYVQQFGEAA